MGKMLFLAYIETLRGDGLGGGLSTDQIGYPTPEEQWNGLPPKMQQFWTNVAMAYGQKN